MVLAISLAIIVHQGFHGFMLRLIVVFTVALMPQLASAVVSNGIVNRFAVVGVISGGNEGRNRGVAVLYDVQHPEQNLFLKVGERLPGYPRFVLQTVQGRRVVVSDGQESVELSQDYLPEPTQSTASSSQPRASEPPPPPLTTGRDYRRSEARDDRPEIVYPEPGFGMDELDDDDLLYDENDVADGLYPPPRRPAPRRPLNN